MLVAYILNGWLRIQRISDGGNCVVRFVVVGMVTCCAEEQR